MTDDQYHTLQQIFETEPYPSQTRLEAIADELSMSMFKVSNWFQDARMKRKPHINSLDIDKLSTSPLNNDDDMDDDDHDNDNDYNSSTVEPLQSSWFNNDTADSDSANSPVSLSTSLTNIVSPVDNKKSIGSTPTSSSKKRKSIPQKIITTKRPTINSTSTENDHNNEIIMSN